MDFASVPLTFMVYIHSKEVSTQMANFQHLLSGCLSWKIQIYSLNIIWIRARTQSQKYLPSLDNIQQPIPFFPSLPAVFSTSSQTPFNWPFVCFLWFSLFPFFSSSLLLQLFPEVIHGSIPQAFCSLHSAQLPPGGPNSHWNTFVVIRCSEASSTTEEGICVFSLLKYKHKINSFMWMTQISSSFQSCSLSLTSWIASIF